VDLLNRTSASALFVNTVASETHLLGAVSIKAAFRCRGEALERDAEAWPASAEPIKTEFGELVGEGPFLREGVDVILLGKAYPPKPGATALTVSIRAGALRHEIAVFGDRSWVRVGPRLVPSRPQPFEAMPLSWERAYGGKARVDAGEMPFAPNPQGRGFYMDEQQADGQPLPNLEDPARPIRTPSDQPMPRCPAPCTRDSSLRMLRAAKFDMDGAVPRVAELRPAYFNNAHPALILSETPRAGDEFEFTHVRPGGSSLRFALPALDFHLHVQLHDRSYVFPAHLESVLVLAEEERVVLGFKSAFRYRMVPLERRIAVLREGPAPSSIPADYRVRWDAVDAAGAADA
jgi:hypothetical protein